NQRTAETLEAKLREAQATYGRQWKGLILDLRGNPGGLLDQAVRSADLFLATGRIAATRGRHPQSSVNHDATEGDLAAGIPIVVLVDGRTASGGEILSSALQDRGRAVVVGTATYGKGLVQTVIDLPNGGEIDLSWSRLHAPSGYALQGLGVLPNICTSGNAANRGLNGLAAGESGLAKTFAQWRTVATGNTGVRKSLRALCPPEDGTAEAEEVARRLLSDRALFTKALAPTGAVAGLRP
ncbi:MAG: S41 family peptidase, partial [Rhodospirillales bacterium]